MKEKIQIVQIKKKLTTGTRVRTVDSPQLRGIVFGEEGGIYDILWDGKHKTVPMYSEQITLISQKGSK